MYEYYIVSLKSLDRGNHEMLKPSIELFTSTARSFYVYTAVQKNRVHFKNQAIKFSSILCFVNVDFDIICICK
jgi:hypothetical protein